ncbi:MAG: YihA family ribosome biogenesis GTP-binding protein [Marinilabiliales bacterium]|nr:MAG: YihA family ribosome biogenesis GTP-binding protein [Marinilabiliales bacterium]
MIVKTCSFVKSSAKINQLPEVKNPEYAFIGRSNVGKSSLINMLVNNKKMAMVSGKPGKTRLINHFQINEKWFLADLPGYGYAKVSKEERKKWSALIRGYLKIRENLSCAFILVDSRHEPQKSDLEFMEWMGENEIPFVIVFTKADKLSSSALNKNLKSYKKKMMQVWEELPSIFISSSNTGLGREEILKFIDQTNQQIELINSK